MFLADLSLFLADLSTGDCSIRMTAPLQYPDLHQVVFHDTLIEQLLSLIKQPPMFYVTVQLGYLNLYACE